MLRNRNVAGVRVCEEEVCVSSRTINEDKVLELHLDRDPLLVGQSGPHVVRLSDGVLVGSKDEFAPLLVDVECAQDEEQAREGGV